MKHTLIITTLLLTLSACQVPEPTAVTALRSPDLADGGFEDGAKVPEMDTVDEVDVPDEDSAGEPCLADGSCPSMVMDPIEPFLDISFNYVDGGYMYRRNSNTPYLNDIVDLQIGGGIIMMRLADGRMQKAKIRASTFSAALFDGGEQTFRADGEPGPLYWWLTVKNKRWISTHTAAIDICVQNVYYCHTLTRTMP